MRSILKYFYLSFASILGFFILLAGLKYFDTDFEKGFLMDKEAVFFHYKYFLYSHVLAAPLTLFTGILQFSLKPGKFHRICGRIYVISILFIAGPSGIYMSFFAIGNWAGTLIFLSLSLFWLYFTFKGYQWAKRKNFSKHKVFMTRSFILTNSAIMIRLFLFINKKMALGDPIFNYLMISLFSWTIPLLIYELLLFQKRKKRSFKNLK